MGVCEQLETLKIVTLLGKTTDSVLNLSKNIISYVSHVLQLMPNTVARTSVASEPNIYFLPIFFVGHFTQFLTTFKSYLFFYMVLGYL